MFTPLPEKLIQTAKGAEDKMKNLDPTRTLSNNRLKEQENNMCITCNEKETCRIYATTRAMEKKKLQTDNEQGKQQTSDKMEDEAPGHQGAADPKEEEEKFRLGNKKQVLNILRENETYKAMKRKKERTCLIHTTLTSSQRKDLTETPASGPRVCR